MKPPQAGRSPKAAQFPPTARSDALANKRHFHRAARRVQAAIYGGEIQPDDEKSCIAWIKGVQKLCSTYGIRLPVAFKMLQGGRNQLSGREVLGLLGQINSALEDIELEIRISDAIMADDDYIELNEDWKTRANTYVSHIREVVSKADMIEALRERIFKRLNELQNELDRNRTHVESITEVFLAVTEAVSKGAKHMDGAIKLIERLAGALSGARTARIEHDTQLRLPPPDNLGLTDPE